MSRSSNANYDSAMFERARARAHQLRAQAVGDFFTAIGTGIGIGIGKAIAKLRQRPAALPASARRARSYRSRPLAGI